MKRGRIQLSKPGSITGDGKLYYRKREVRLLSQKANLMTLNVDECKKKLVSA